MHRTASRRRRAPPPCVPRPPPPAASRQPQPQPLLTFCCCTTARWAHSAYPCPGLSGRQEARGRDSRWPRSASCCDRCHSGDSQLPEATVERARQHCDYSRVRHWTVEWTHVLECMCCCTIHTLHRVPFTVLPPTSCRDACPGDEFSAMSCSHMRKSLRDVCPRIVRITVLIQ